MLSTFDAGLRNWLVADESLAAMVAGRVYHDLAPIGAAMPYVVITLQSSRDPERTPNDEIELTYNVKAVAGTTGEAVRVADAVRAALDSRRPEVAGWGVYWCKETSAFRFVEMIERTLIAYAGGLYRVGAIRQGV